MSDDEFRRTARQVNQRIRRVEQYLETSDLEDTDALRLARYYLTGTGRKRFPENPARLTDEEKEYFRDAMANVLNDTTSSVQNIKTREYLADSIRKAVRAPMGEFNPFAGESFGQDFYDLFNQAKRQGLVQAFDYKTISKIISWRIKKRRSGNTVVENISRAIEKAAATKKITRKELLKQFRES